MSAISTPAPDGDPVLQRLIVESRARLPERMRARERAVDLVAAGAFVVVAAAMAIAFEPSRALEPAIAVALVACYALASRVEFAMGSGWAVPTQLVFVPMLFLLPTATVPLFVAAALLVSRMPEYLRGSVHTERALIRVAEAWYASGPRSCCRSRARPPSTSPIGLCTSRRSRLSSASISGSRSCGSGSRSRSASGRCSRRCGRSTWSMPC